MAPAGVSPPRHRHDGTSPLPLGMDASTAPVRWNGVNTVWPNDFRSGWSYCVMVPNWLTIPQAKTADGNAINPTVYYRVQVGIQSPQGISTVRDTLRRFSDFLKLFAALKKIFPDKKLPAAPPKNTLMRINSSQALLQERRRALEDWISKLLADIEISRSVAIASFLELEAAARYAINTISEQEASSTVTAGLGATGSSIMVEPRSGLSWTGGGSSVASGPFPSGLDYGSDATNDTPVVGTPTKNSEGELEMEALAIEQEAAINKAENGVSRPKRAPRSRRDPSSSTMEASERTASGQLEMERDSERHPSEVGTADQGISAGPVSNLRHAFSAESVTSWHRRKGSHESLASDVESVRGSEQSVGPSLDGQMEASGWSVATMDEGLLETEAVLKGVGVGLPMDQRSKVRRVLLMMQRKLSGAKADIEDLNARLHQETAVKEFLTIKVRDLEAELDTTRRKSRDVLQQAVSIEREKVTNLLWELEECKTSLMNLEEQSESEKEARLSLEERLAQAEAAKEEAAKEMADVREKMLQLQKERDQARADKKVLVKEMKSLLREQPKKDKEIELAKEAKLELENILHEERHRQETNKASRAKFLHHVAMLRQRLQECTVDYLAREEERSPNKTSAGATDALDLLSTSDNRIGLLLAEAQLLAQQGRENSSNTNALPNGVHSNGAGAAPQEKLHELPGGDEENEAELQQILTDLIIDNAQMRRAMNHSLTQSAISSHKGEKEPVDGAPVRKSVLSKFLGQQ
ncbi:unnamed protein product [Calypogeia fissa]